MVDVIFPGETRRERKTVKLWDQVLKDSLFHRVCRAVVSRTRNTREWPHVIHEWVTAAEKSETYDFPLPFRSTVKVATV